MAMALALNFSAAFLHPKPSSSSSSSSSSVTLKQKHLLKLHSSVSSCFKAFAQPEGSGGGVTEEDPPAFPESSSSTRSQLNLLEQLTSARTFVDGYESDGTPRELTIREQLAQLVRGRDDDFAIPLGKKNLKKVSPKFLTISQKRNIKRQAYLDEVSQRNDSVFFATIGAFVILPPVIILGIAILTGYVQLFP